MDIYFFMDLVLLIGRNELFSLVLPVLGSDCLSMYMTQFQIRGTFEGHYPEKSGFLSDFPLRAVISEMYVTHCIF